MKLYPESSEICVGSREYTRKKEIYQVRARRGGRGELWNQRGPDFTKSQSVMSQKICVDIEVIQNVSRTSLAFVMGSLLDTETQGIF